MGHCRSNALRGLAVSFGLLIVCHTCVLGQQSDCNTWTIQVQFSTAVPDLTPSMLRAELNKETVAVDRVDRAEPKRVLIVLDTSSSMTDVFSTALDVVDVLVSSTPPEVPVGFFAPMQGGADMAVNFGTRSRREVSQSVAGLRQASPSGTIELLDTINKAIVGTQPHRSGDLLIFITDGLGTTSKRRSEEIEKLLVSGGMEFDTVVLRQSRQVGGLVEGLGNSLPEISGHTGGRSFSFSQFGMYKDRRLRDMREAADLISRPRWRAMLKAPHPPDKWGHLKLKVDGLPRGTFVAYPVLWPPCGN